MSSSSLIIFWNPKHQCSWNQGVWKEAAVASHPAKCFHKICPQMLNSFTRESWFMEFKIGFLYGWIILWRKTEKEKKKKYCCPKSFLLRPSQGTECCGHWDDGNIGNALYHIETLRDPERVSAKMSSYWNFTEISAPRQEMSSRDLKPKCTSPVKPLIISVSCHKLCKYLMMMSR